MDGASTVPASAPQLVLQKIQIQPDAPLGAYLVQYSSEAASAVLAGGIRIVVNPVVLLAEQGGQRVVIKGTDLAPVTAVAQEWFDGAPKPTQLGGISVRIGDRFAGLWSVSPGEIVTELPSGLTGESVKISVLAGAGMESEAISLRLNLQ